MSSYLKLAQPLLELHIRSKQSRIVVVRLLSSSQVLYKDDKTAGTKELSKKYSNTLFLPKTSFPVRVEGKKRTVRDEEIANKCGFESQYQWQRKHRRPGCSLSINL